ncbi:hypothetical protein [Nostoc sp.]|uniref:hypothetical protein n=1 Tax=Nostoc sp. TaxID=1180 RepID=UPI002FFB3E7B
MIKKSFWMGNAQVIVWLWQRIEPICVASTSLRDAARSLLPQNGTTKKANSTALNTSQ